MDATALVFPDCSNTVSSLCRIGPGCIFLGSDFHGIRPKKCSLPEQSAPLMVGGSVWPGSEVMVLKGVHGGRDTVVGVRCVVTRSLEAGAISVGNPARMIGSVYA